MPRGRTVTRPEPSKEYNLGRCDSVRMTKLSEMGEKEAVRRILAEIAEKEGIQRYRARGRRRGGRPGVRLPGRLHRPIVSQSTHVLPTGMTDWQIGWTVAAVNFSDIAAMGAQPLGLLVAMGLPRTMPFGEISDESSRGSAGLLRIGRWRMLGGDTKEGPEMVCPAPPWAPWRR